MSACLVSRSAERYVCAAPFFAYVKNRGWRQGSRLGREVGEGLAGDVVDVRDVGLGEGFQV